MPPFLRLVHVLRVQEVHKAFLFSFSPCYHLHTFIILTSPCVFPCAICFIWRCTSSIITRTIIAAFLVSSRSSVLLAGDTSGIVRSIPASVTITACIADFYAIEHHKYKKLYQNNGLKYSRILCVIVELPPQESNQRKQKQGHQPRQKGRIYRPKCT